MCISCHDCIEYIYIIIIQSVVITLAIYVRTASTSYCIKMVVINVLRARVFTLVLVWLALSRVLVVHGQQGKSAIYIHIRTLFDHGRYAVV